MKFAPIFSDSLPGVYEYQIRAWEEYPDGPGVVVFECRVRPGEEVEAPPAETLWRGASGVKYSHIQASAVAPVGVHEYGIGECPSLAASADVISAPAEEAEDALLLAEWHKTLRRSA